MGSIIIRNLDDEIKEQLREQAEKNGRSMEAEARDILSQGVSADLQHNSWVFEWKKLGEELGQVEMPERGGHNEARIPDFSGES